MTKFGASGTGRKQGTAETASMENAPAAFAQDFFRRHEDRFFRAIDEAADETA
ncbi:hypothetical protein [Rhizobium terrae]|uniref:hypothetical protein n=1 Tax=Rhizobium terrae TaxID=2171756 RepID=UPI0013C36451|nr:hypothetical protein [Rhizobium terrae]